MADFILLEPSCDIHLAVEGLPAAKRALVLRVLEGNGDALAQGQTEPTHFQIQEVPVVPEFDFFPLDQAVVRFDTATRSLTPLVPGTVYMQVRYLDPIHQDVYHYLVARIQVHKKFNGWWFGNKSLSVFKNESEANSQPSIYALFDKDEPGGGVVADITGHNYVDLTVDHPAICRLDTSFQDAKLRDRLRGMAEGETRLRGALLGQNWDIPVSVVDLRNRPIDPLRPILQRRALFDATVHRAEKHNILFLAEGFTANEEGKFNEAVTETSRIVFDSNRHAPYPLLKEGFNTWSHREVSKESGLTVGPQLQEKGIPIPPPLDPVNGPPGAYTLQGLIGFVGLPTPADDERTVDELKDLWNAAGAIPQMLGFNPNLAVENVVMGWQRLVPRGIPQAIDSFHGLMQGRRWGERNSVAQLRVDMVTPPAPGDPQFNDKRARLGRRMFEWYQPDLLTHYIVTDPRRYAPENKPLDIKQFGLDLLISHISRFADGSVAAGSPDHHVGKLWDMLTAPDQAAPSRQINSAGLVCLFANSEHKAGAANASAMVRVSIGAHRLFATELHDNIPNVRRLSLLSEVKPKYSEVADLVAHEFGHCFNLADEYEVLTRPSSQQQGLKVEARDNVTFVETIQVAPPPGGHSLDFPTPVDPAKIKWARLHRIAVSDMLVQKSVIDGAQIKVRLAVVATAADAAKWEPIRAKWQKIKDESKKVFLRRYKPTNGNLQQLPLSPQDLYSDLNIDDVKPDGTVILSGQPDPKEFPAGSVLYVPKRDKSNNLLTMVEPQVLQYMSTTRWKSGDNSFPLGVALTENHNKDVAGRSDPASNAADNPPDIPNYKKPCKGYKLVGLYEGGGAFTTNTYRPAGACKMRNQEGSEGEGEFCFLCKYLLVNRIDPSKHPVLDERFYPRKKKWWGK